MSYEEAVEAAGAKIDKVKYYGSCEGYFLIKLGNGNYIYDSFGSCSGCDSFESEFCYIDSDSPEYRKKLASFGSSYLNLQQSKEDLIKRFNDDDYLSDEEQEILTDLESGAI